MSDASRPEAGIRVPDDLSGITAEQYRTSMRHYPSGVTVVTLSCADGPIGFTATSFASLSLEPPLISFNIAHTSSSMAAMLDADSVVVHFLGEHQRHIAQRFSRAAGERFTDRSLWTTLDTGEPVLHGTPIWVRAVVHQLIPIGDHTLVIGLVTRVHDNTDEKPAAAPLLYYNGRYHRPTELDT
ncbi:flavin reductase family protein [Nocardia puris]|uniref:Flavin reductase (DIM6/NTAB) family NADH-FMN oxidoreductase RutF n=1 Tax=Nocardia puris TaxID=208602 RepID=A0A366DBA7_9NOCA|nr:flavin reductase family protein [Nocardia puris]MBF6214612.1 flavin reductase family protein [Nocardia puris]MBF6366021.1 flavin reductase family protein [Nocardia puris]MBF6460336.1 flavin reductase family protein [Nocardia puris]RBO87331.1 flavin reductase (DIM6/NTAB) family NADH-FMN oxidoreductase RutF [Nocardia puris]